MSDAPARAQMPDHLRLIALFGIVVVNVQYIAYPESMTFPLNAGLNAIDSLTIWLVNGLAFMKSYGLFSFMFGVGLGFLMRSAARRGLPFGKIYRNRMVGLFVLGFLHGFLFFTGDILAIYAAAGSILYFMRNWSPGRLVKWGAALLIVQVTVDVALLLAYLVFELEIAHKTDPAFIELMTTGTYAEVVAARSAEFLETYPFMLFFQGIGAMGWFCLGLAAVQSGMIDDATHPLWKRARRWCLVPGLAISMIGAAAAIYGNPFVAVVLVVCAAPIATLGYLGVIAMLPRPKGRIMSKALLAGGASLSVYLGQSIILSTVFAGYGLGFWSQMSQTAATVLSVVVTAVLIAAVAAWQSRLGMPPFERLLRAITYAGTARG